MPATKVIKKKSTKVDSPTPRRSMTLRKKSIGSKHSSVDSTRSPGSGLRKMRVVSLLPIIVQKFKKIGKAGSKRKASLIGESKSPSMSLSKTSKNFVYDHQQLSPNASFIPQPAQRENQAQVTGIDSDYRN